MLPLRRPLFPDCPDVEVAGMMETRPEAGRPLRRLLRRREAPVHLRGRRVRPRGARRAIHGASHWPDAHRRDGHYPARSPARTHQCGALRRQRHQHVHEHLLRIFRSRERAAHLFQRRALRAGAHAPRRRVAPAAAERRDGRGGARTALRGAGDRPGARRSWSLTDGATEARMRRRGIPRSACGDRGAQRGQPAGGAARQGAAEVTSFTGREGLEDDCIAPRRLRRPRYFFLPSYHARPQCFDFPGSTGCATAAWRSCR